MDYRRILRRRDISVRTMFYGVAFIAAFAAASLVDLDALLRYFKVIGGRSFTALETGAIISMACAIPFLAMGMSIAADSYQAQRRHQ